MADIPQSPIPSSLMAKKKCPSCSARPLNDKALSTHISAHHKLYMIITNSTTEERWGICQRNSEKGYLFCCFPGCNMSAPGTTAVMSHLRQQHSLPTNVSLRHDNIHPDGNASTASSLEPDSLESETGLTATEATTPDPEFYSPKTTPIIRQVTCSSTSSDEEDAEEAQNILSPEKIWENKYPFSPNLNMTSLSLSASQDRDTTPTPLGQDSPESTRHSRRQKSQPSILSPSNSLYLDPVDPLPFLDQAEQNPVLLPWRCSRRPQRSRASTPSGSPPNPPPIIHTSRVSIDHGSDTDSESETSDDSANEEETQTRKMLEQVGLVYVPVDNEIGVLACIACETGIKPSTTISHISSGRHKSRKSIAHSKESKAAVRKWVEKMGGKLADNQSDLPIELSQRVAPVDNLPIHKGLACSQCTYCCLKESSLRVHWEANHGGLGMDRDSRSDVESVQTYFKQNPKYFVVTTALKGKSRRSLVSLYVHQYSKEIHNSRSSIGNPPISPMELPPLHQETQWPAHLREFINSPRKIRHLRDLITFPTGKNADEDPLANTLRYAIVIYLKNIKSIALDSPLSIRELLMQLPSQGKCDPWRPLLNEKSLQAYARFLHHYVYALLLTWDDSHCSGYDFRLSEDDKNRARCLVDALEKQWDKDQDLESNFRNGRKYSGNADNDDEIGIYQSIGEDGEEEEGEEINDYTPVLDDNDNACDSKLIQHLHNFIKPLLYPGHQLRSGAATVRKTKWDEPIERFMAVFSLRADGNFKQAHEVTQMFAMFHYIIRGTILYEGMQKCNEQEHDDNGYVAVEEEAAKNLRPSSQSPYIICQSYQRLASSIAKNVNGPPTTTISEDEMTISFREHSLHIPTWRAGLSELSADVENQINKLCYGEDFGLSVPAVVPDDWTNDTRGYSWTNNDPDCFGLPWGKSNISPLFSMGLQKGTVAKIVDGKIQLNKPAMAELLIQCDAVCENLFLLIFFTAGQPPRVTEIADYKFANSTRGRNMFHHDGAIWLLNRRVKFESLLRKESSIGSKASPQVTQSIQKYLLLIRPLEKELIYHLTEGEDRKTARQLYSEYLWMRSGVKMTPADLCSLIRTFLGEKCDADIGPRSYRQICVEIGRIFLGSEAEIKAQESDIINAQGGHSTDVARNNYALEVGHLPGMSSDLLLRYGRISKAWWGVVGFNNGDPLQTVRVREGLAAAIAASRDEATSSLLSLVAELKKDVQMLRARTEEMSKKR